MYNALILLFHSAILQHHLIIEKQRTIGNLYRQSIIQNDLMVKQAEDVRKFTMTLIRRMEED
mgnify:CR=1 FL=1